MAVSGSSTGRLVPPHIVRVVDHCVAVSRCSGLEDCLVLSLSLPREERGKRSGVQRRERRAETVGEELETDGGSVFKLA